MSILDRCEPRDGYGVRVLVVHTTEGGGTAQSLRDAPWWTGSSHAIADESGTLLTPAEGMVPYSMAAWTLRSGNRWSENIELVGYASYTRDDWLARPKLLDACAKWLRDRAAARGIPLVKITADEYRAGRSGVIGHVDHTIGYADGTHWDPGPNFPYDVVLTKARGEEDDMPSADEVATAVMNSVVTMPDKTKASLRTVLGSIVGRQKSQQKQLDALADKLTDIESKVTPPPETPLP